MGIDPENINILNPEVNDVENECNEYEKRINNNIDLCILGIGRNGHIAFNEPGCDWDLEFFDTPLDKVTKKDLRNLEVNEVLHCLRNDFRYDF